MKTVLNENKIELQGKLTKITDEIKTGGEKFIKGIIKVKRQSENYDFIPVLISKRISEEEIKEGDFLFMKGEVRTRNYFDKDEKRHMNVFVFVKEIKKITEEENENLNKTEIEGFICKNPVYRVSPLGREVCDLIIAVNRNFGKSSYIPMISWGRCAKFSGRLPVGTKIKISGRLQSRNYTKDGEEKTTVELSITFLEVLEEPETVDFIENKIFENEE